MPALKRHVAEQGYSSPKKIFSIKRRAGSKPLKSEGCVCPRSVTLPNTYLKYYLYPDYEVAHSTGLYAGQRGDGRT
jgi:maltose-6'-phosphate glucosidase